MAKATQLKLIRKFKPEYLIDGAETVISRVEYVCCVCQKALFVSVGQIVKCHKDCRQEYKRIVKYQKEHAKLVPNYKADIQTIVPVQSEDIGIKTE